MKYLSYIIMCILQPICWPLPEITTILYGTHLLGNVQGFLIGYVFILIGIALMYKISFYLSDKFLVKFKKSNKFEKFKNYVSKNEIITTGLLFVLPILPDEIICVGSAILEIKFSVIMGVAIFAKFICVGMIAFSSTFADVLQISNFSVILIELFIIWIASKLYSKYKEKNFKSL